MLGSRPPRARFVQLAGASCLVWAASACSDGPGADSSDGSSGLTPKLGTLYVALAGDASVAVVDETSGKVTASIPVDRGPAIILKTPDDKQLYTANWAANSVSSIDAVTKEVASIPVGGRPYVIAMAPNGSEVYVGLSTNQLAVIDTTTKAIARRYPTPELPGSLIVSPDGQTIYVATFPPTAAKNELRALNTQTGEEVHERIEVGNVPAWITISPDGRYVYTLNFYSDDVSVVDTESWSVVATIETGEGSRAIIGHVTPDNAELWVTNHQTQEAVAISTNDRQITKTIPLDGKPVGIAFNDAGGRVYVTDFGPDSYGTPPDANYLLTGVYGATYNGQLSIFDRTSGAAIGDKIELGPGATSVVSITTPQE